MLLRHKLEQYLKRQAWFRPIRFANLARRSRRRRPDWSQLLGADERAALVPPTDGQRVLIATSVGLHLAVSAADSVFAAALLARGAQVDVLLCDAAVPACMAGEMNWYPRPERFVEVGVREFCDACIGPALRMLDPLPVRVRRYSEFLTDDDREWAATVAAGTALADVGDVVVDGLPVGEHALAGALRFFARGDLSTEPLAESIAQRYLESSLLTARVGQRAYRDGGYTVTVLHHGIYVPQGILAAAARAARVRLVCWNLAYRQRCFIFSHDDTYHRTLMDEPTQEWDDMAWSPDLDKHIGAYIRSRAAGAQDWVTFYDKAEHDFAAIATEFGLDPAKPLVLLLTNVVWDAQLHYPGNAFPTMLDWILATVEHVAGRPDLQLVIRVHPAEVTGAVPSRQRVADELGQRFGRLPANVVIVPPDHPASSYVIAQHANVALVYATRMGVELAALGLPVVVAGEAWVRNKGLTIDVRDRAHYSDLLASLPLQERPDEDQVARARRYAFHFFFRRMVPVNAVAPQAGWPPFAVDPGGLGGLKAGADPGLDIICDGILNGSSFIYPAEREFLAPGLG